VTNLRERHFAELRGQLHYEKFVELITFGPALVLVVEGPEDTWQDVHALRGATKTKDAVAGAIRGDFEIGHRDNVVHGSDSATTAQREIENFSTSGLRTVIAHLRWAS
jgi:nucleoside-diphosphate kinase